MALLLVPLTAFADRGALSADVGGGVESGFVPAPYSEGARPTAGTVPAVTLGARYALTNSVELSLSGFFTFPMTYWHNGGSIGTPNGALTGSLSHQLVTYGGTAGVRLVKGEQFRWVVGCETGWIHRAYSQFTAWNDANPANVAPYALSPPLADVSLDNLMLQPMAGFQWAGGDHWAVSVVPRAQLVLGAYPTVGLLVPIEVSWSWYL